MRTEEAQKFTPWRVNHEARQYFFGASSPYPFSGNVADEPRFSHGTSKVGRELISFENIVVVL